MASSLVEYVASLRDRVSPSLNRIRDNVRRTNSSMQEMNNQINSVGLAVAGLAIGYGALKAVNIAGEYEQQGIAFETMLGSVEKGQQMLVDLDKFATQTHFSIRGAQDSAKQLMAVGIEGEKIIPTLKALGDMSAGLNVPLERLALNYGQIKSQAKLTGRELRDFAVAGVPLTGELAKMLKVSEKAIQDMVSEGKIGFPLVEKAFQNMTGEGGRFANLMQKQNKTFLGQYNEMIENIQILARQIGNALIPILRPFVNLISKMVEIMKKNEAVVKAVVLSLVALGTVIITIIAYIKAWALIQAVLNIVLAANPIGLFVVAIVALIGVVYVVTTAVYEWMKTTAIGNGILEALSVILSFVWGIIKKVGMFLINIFIGALKNTWTAIKTLGGYIMDFLAKPIEVAMGLFNKFLDMLEKIPGVGKLVKNIRKAYQKGYNKITLENKNEEEKKTLTGKSKTGSILGGAGGSTLTTTPTKVTSSAPKVFNINFNNKIIETFNVVSHNIKESPSEIKNMITQTLLESLADIEIAR